MAPATTTTSSRPCRSRWSDVRATAVLLVAGALATAPGAVRADESRVKLADAPELSLVRARCSVCHSLDYIPMNAPFLNRAGWDGEVHKMIKVMGAPISEDEAARIIDYLSQHYGPAT